jgi:hypothetical protein
MSPQFNELIESWKRRANTCDKVAIVSRGLGDKDGEKRCEDKAEMIRGMADELRQEILRQGNPKGATS